jgi:hypothetical protein
MTVFALILYVRRARFIMINDENTRNSPTYIVVCSATNEYISKSKCCIYAASHFKICAARISRGNIGMYIKIKLNNSMSFLALIYFQDQKESTFVSDATWVGLL